MAIGNSSWLSGIQQGKKNEVIYYTDNNNKGVLGQVSGLYYSWAHLPRGMFVGSLFKTQENKGLSDQIRCISLNGRKRKEGSR